MGRVNNAIERLNVRSWAWFVLLWIAGVVGTAMLALPFRLLVGIALHKWP
jgi:hypothetical protein